MEPITDTELTALLTAQDNHEIFWDRNDEMSGDEIQKIVKGGTEALDEIVEETLERNSDNIWEARMTTCKNVLAEIGTRPFAALSPEANADEDSRIDHLMALDEEIPFSANLNQLAKNTGNGYFTIRTAEPCYHQAYRGITNPDDLAEILTILNISPHHYQNMVADGVTLPAIPERDGNEYVEPSAFGDVLKETMYGGELVFLCQLSVADVIKNAEAFRTGEITVHKGTLLMLHDYLNGASSCEDGPLLKDIVFPPRSARLHYDQHNRLGVQSCCNMTEVPWKPGHATAKLPDTGNAPNCLQANQTVFMADGSTKTVDQIQPGDRPM